MSVIDGGPTAGHRTAEDLKSLHHESDDCDAELLKALRQLVWQLARDERLANREADVVFETLRGRGTKEVAFVIGCSEASVYTYWSRILAKAQVPTRERFVAYVVALALKAPERRARDDAAASITDEGKSENL